MLAPHRFLLLAAGVLLSAAAGSAQAAPLAPGTTRLLDRPTGEAPLPADGNSGALGSQDRVLSGDGRFAAFDSAGDDLALATGGSRQQLGVYVRDRLTGTVENVCRSTAGALGTEGCSSPALSPNGRYVAFTSTSDELATPVPTSFGIYLRDRQTGTTTLVSRTTTGSADAGFPTNPSVADNGTVAFQTGSALDAAIDTGNSRSDVYVRTIAGVTRLLSKVGSTVGNNGSGSPSISADGTVVAFVSTSSNFDAADVNGVSDVYTALAAGANPVLRSRVGASGAVGNGASSNPSISGTGSQLAFETAATNLTSAVDTNTRTDVVLRTESPVANVPVSVVDGSSSTLLARGGSSPQLAVNGGKVAFQTRDAAVPTADAVALRDVGTLTTRIVSRRDGLSGAIIDGRPQGITSDGSTVLIGTSSLDAGLIEQLWARNVSAGTNERVSRAGTGTEPLGQADSALLGDTSGDGRFTVFTSSAVGLGGTDEGRRHVYLRDERSQVTTQLDRPSVPGAPAGDVVDARISDDGAPVRLSSDRSMDLSGDGTRIAFSSAENFIPGDVNTVQDVFVRDLVAGTVELASRPEGMLGSFAEDAIAPILDEDGSKVAFTTRAILDSVGDQNINADAYVRDLTAGRTILVSRPDGAGSIAGSGSSEATGISAKGDRVVFQSNSSVLGNGDTTTDADVHVRELSTDRTLWASRPPGGAQNDSDAYSGVISADGNRVVFESSSSRFAVGVAPGEQALYVQDLSGGNPRLLVSPPGFAAMLSYSPRLSANGQCVVFVTPAAQLPGLYPSPDYQHAYLRAIDGGCVQDDPPAAPPTPTPSTPAAKDAVAPILSGLRSSRRSLTRRGKRATATLTVTASEAVTLRLEAARLTAGKRKRGACLAPSKVKGKARACVREGTLTLIRTAAVGAGTQRLGFDGKTGGKRLRPGRYRLILTATDAAGNRSVKRLTIDVTLLR